MKRFGKTSTTGVFVGAIFIIFAVSLFFQFILQLTGNNTIETQVMYVIFTALFFCLMLISYNLGQFVGEVRGFMKESRVWRKESDRRFYAFTTDYRKHAERMH